MIVNSDLSSNQPFLLFTGAAGSSCQIQEAFSSWPVLPHLWSGGLHVRTGAGLYLRLSILLHTSGQLFLLSSVLMALNVKHCQKMMCHILTQLCCITAADPRGQLVPLPGYLRGLGVRSSKGQTRTRGKCRYLSWWQLWADQCTCATLWRQRPCWHHPWFSEGKPILTTVTLSDISY